MREWRTDAACLGHEPEMWCADHYDNPEAAAVKAEAQRICRDCPVRQACLDEANRLEHGLGKLRRTTIRGGLSGLARYKISGPPSARRVKVGAA